MTPISRRAALARGAALTLAKDRLTRVLDTLLGWFFRRFNRAFGRAASGYGRGVGFVVSRKATMMVL